MMLLAVLLAGERAVVGVWDRWAAMRDVRPPRCFAIAQPVATDGGADGGADRRGGFASVAVRVGAERRQKLYLRLSAPRRTAAPLTLAIGERRFALSGDAMSATAPDPGTDRAIVGAMRGGRSMSVAGVRADGRGFAETYALQGAATAIDAAAVACR